jgi:phosphate transport system substrate-binding protein
MLGVGLAGIIEVCNIFITPTIYLLLNIFMLALGALMLFFSGRVWADDSAPEKREIAVWRQCLFFSTRIINPGGLDNRAASGRLSISPDGSGLVG